MIRFSCVCELSLLFILHAAAVATWHCIENCQLRPPPKKNSSADTHYFCIIIERHHFCKVKISKLKTKNHCNHLFACALFYSVFHLLDCDYAAKYKFVSIFGKRRNESKRVYLKIQKQDLQRVDMLRIVHNNTLFL